MKTFIATIICIAISFCIQAENNAIDGIYNSLHYKMLLDNERFQIIRLGTGHGLFVSDEVIAEGYYSKLGNNLLELNSDSTSSAAFVMASQKIEYKTLSHPSDSIEVYFDIPTDQYLSIEFDYYVEGKETDDNCEVELEYIQNHSQSVIIPRSYYIFGTIRRKIGILYNWLPTHCFYGIPEIFVNFHIPENCSKVRISMPGIKGNFFDRMFLKGEYALIEGNTIRFKGETFYKIKE